MSQINNMATSFSVKIYSVFSKSLRTSLVKRPNVSTAKNQFLLSRCSYSSSSEHPPADAGSEVPPPVEASEERDPYPLYSQSDVQALLTRITGFDLHKVAGPQIKPLQAPSYLLLTDEELAQKQTEAKERVKYRLQMPPFMNPRKPFTEPLLVDPDLAGHDISKIVFADISFGVKDRRRNVVVRHPDGNLHVASWDVKERVNQIYNPREGRHVIKPAMFEEQHLERMLSEGKYVYILDRASCQFEPDDPDYIRTTRRVYNAVNSAKAYDSLRSSRHFGPLAFYLAWNRMIDSLLLDMINKDLESDAKDLVQLFTLVHPDTECAQRLASLGSPEPADVIKSYIDTDSQLKDQLELALQALQDSNQSKSKHDHGS